MTVSIYRNHRSRNWSVVENEHTHKVKHRVQTALLIDCDLRVRTPGIINVALQGTKGVKAIIHGKAIWYGTGAVRQGEGWTRVRFDPYTMNGFEIMPDGPEIFTAKEILLGEHGQVFAKL